MKCMKARRGGIVIKNKWYNTIYEVIKTIPLYIFFFIMVGIMHSLSNAILLHVNKLFFDTVAMLFKNLTNIRATVFMAMAVGCINILALLFNGIHNFMYEKINYIATGLLKQVVFDKVGKVQPICFEDPSKIECIEKADQGINNIFNICMTIVTIISFYIPYFIMVSVYLYKLSPSLVFALLIIFIPVIVSQAFRYKIFDRLIDNTIPYYREYKYYDECISSKEYFKETRFCNAESFFMNKFIHSLSLYSIEMWRENKKSLLIRSIFKIFTILGYIGVLFLLTNLYMKKAITVGIFASVFTSIRTMYNLMNELLGTHIGAIVENYSSVKKFNDFMNLPEISISNNNSNIDIRNLNFKYPGSDDNALTDINLHIDQGEVVALVGMNGSGKSTLAKIIATIYQTSDGDVRLFPKQDISMIFQDYKRYKMTLTDNIRIGDFERLYSWDEIGILTNEAGIDISVINEMKDCILSPEFGGMDLSGGQWQRIAIARALYKTHTMIILDEPTAAINPLEESRIFKEFIDIVKGKTALLITHRLGSVKIANRIIVMKNGRIIEDNNFQNLMNQKGEFYHLYNAQAEFYK